MHGYFSKKLSPSYSIYHLLGDKKFSLGDINFAQYVSNILWFIRVDRRSGPDVASRSKYFGLLLVMKLNNILNNILNN